MRAMILAAGLGERLRPLTLLRAKPALPLLNRPLILRTLDYLRLYGVRQAVINLHHLPGSITDVVTAAPPPVLQITYSHEAVILGTAGGLKNAEPRFEESGTLIMINSDFVIDCDLGAALQAHRHSGALATMVLIPATPEQAYGVVEMAADGAIHRISGRPASRTGIDGPGYTFTGIHLLEPEIFDHIPAGVPCCINKDIYPRLLESGRAIQGFVHRGQWLELGTPELFLQGSFELLRTMAEPPPVPAPAGVNGLALIGPGSTFGDGASCSGEVIAGGRLRMGQGSSLRRTIVHDEVEIGAASTLLDCIVDSGVTIPPDTDLERAMVVPWSDVLSRARPPRRLGDCAIVEF